MQAAFVEAGVAARYWVVDTTDQGAQIEVGDSVAQVTPDSARLAQRRNTTRKR
jgi:hypothetical protein